MNTTATISPLLTKGSLLTEKPFEASDELMLEELERRDGIYSFIFHELEAPKNDNNNSESDLNCVQMQANRRQSRLPSKNFFKSIEIVESAHNNNNNNNISNTTTNTNSSGGGSGNNENNNTNNSFKLTTTKNSLPITKPTSAANSSGVVSETTLKVPMKNEFIRYQQYLKTWFPPTPTVNASHINLLKSTQSTVPGPPPFYLDKRQTNFYAYMMNCGVSVRPQPPRFSHIIEPLVRNRHHAIKDSKAYKQQKCVQQQPPDLRNLFPHDPDVYTPFINPSKNSSNNNNISKASETEVGSCLKIETVKELEQSTLLPPCSEINKN